MNKVVRLNNTTMKLLEEWKEILRKDFLKVDIELFKDILENENQLIQSALRQAIWTDRLTHEKSKNMD